MDEYAVLAATGTAYVTGYTNSTNFPTRNPFQAANAGFTDAFIAKVNPAGTGLVYSTYLGGGINENATGIAVDGSGNAYVAGQTESYNFPTANPIEASTGAGGSEYTAFVSELNAAGSALVYSTYLGWGGSDAAGITVDASGDTYVTGLTYSYNFPLKNALQSTMTGNQVSFVTEFAPLGTSFVFSTYLGGANTEAMAIAVDGNNQVYVTGLTYDTNYYLYPGSASVCAGTGTPYQSTNKAVSINGHDYTGFVTVFSAQAAPPPAPIASVSPSGLTFASQTVNTTSASQPVTLSNTGTASLSISSIGMTGTNAGDFAQTNTCGSSVAAGASCTISVTFTPTTSGTRTASLAITDNATGSPQTVTLSGTGAAASGGGSSSVSGATSTQQYILTGSDGTTWQDMDPSHLTATVTPSSSGQLVLSGNSDLWTSSAGYNQDIGIWVSGGSYGSGQVVAWKESGGFAGTFSPNAAFVQTALSLQAGTSYTVKLMWKSNKQDSGTIWAGAGPIAGNFSPTRLTAEILP